MTKDLLRPAAATSFNNNLHALQDAAVQLRRVATTPSTLSSRALVGVILKQPFSSICVSSSFAHGCMALFALPSGESLVHIPCIRFWSD